MAYGARMYTTVLTQNESNTFRYKNLFAKILFFVLARCGYTAWLSIWAGTNATVAIRCAKSKAATKCIEKTMPLMVFAILLFSTTERRETKKSILSRNVVTSISHCGKTSRIFATLRIQKADIPPASKLPSDCRRTTFV